MAIAGIFPDARAQQQPNLDSQNVIAPADFLRILVRPAEVEGRANLFTDWQQGEVFLSQGRFASGITFNYDVLNHVLLVLVDEKEFSLNPIAVDSILMANSSQVLINPIILDGVGSDLLLLRVYEGLHLSLFRNTLAKVMDGDNNTTSTTELVYAHNSDIQIDQEQMYFLLNKATNEFRELQGKKKELKKWENGDQVVAFVKNQNLDLKNEADLIQVVQYYEQLTFGVH
jgi:hypothetical protein